MKFTEDFSNRIITEAESIKKQIEDLPVLSISDLDSKKTMGVFVDIINGFINEGAMAAQRIGDIIPHNARLAQKLDNAGIFSVAFADCHKENAAEFASFPPHCIEGTRESLVVDELQAAGNYILIPKNSTNGFHEEKFREILSERPETDTFIVTGDCTDICVMQFCLALKTYFTMNDKNVRIIIPVSCTETYDAPYHSSDFANIAAVKLMSDSGISFVSDVE